MNQNIEIIISAEGQSRVETKGFTGSDCRTASQFLEQALGQTASEQLKPEFYQSASEEEHVQEGL